MFAPISMAGPQPFNDWFDPDTVARNQLGLVVDAVDSFWGGGRFMYVTATTTIPKGSLVVWDENYVAAVLPDAANQGFPVGVLMQSMEDGEFGWLQLQGFAPVSAAASVAADDPVGIGAAGQAGANSAGKQLLGVRARLASTATLDHTADTLNGSNKLVTSGYDGWFVGMELSGTGIPASTVIAKLNADGRTVYMGSAIGLADVNATATGNVTVTGTWTGYVGLLFNNPFAQGAVT